MDQFHIYKITVDTFPSCYVGSTTLSLNDRFNAHKSQSKMEKPSCTSYILFTKGEPKIELIESIIGSAEEAKYRERYWQERLDTVNKMTPIISAEERRIRNIARVTARNSTQVTCECGHTHTRHGTPYHIASKKHQQYLKNKEPKIV